jgi:PAS domain S-box-containing protein
MTNAVTDLIRDPARLAALRSTALLDSLPEPSFDRLTHLAARVLSTPAAIVTLIDEDRQFFKSSLGLPEPWSSRRQTPLTHSFCKTVVATGHPLVVEDARRHPLVCDNLAIADLGVVAYLGTPLTLPDGEVLGSFCVIDNRPRAWTEEDLETLRDLAASVLTEIVLRIDNAERRRVEEALRISEARYRTMIDQSPVSIQVFAGDGALERVNRAWEVLWETDRDQVAGYNILHDAQLEAKGAMPLIRRAFAGEAVTGVRFHYDPAENGLTGRPRWVEAAMYPIRGEDQAVREVVLMLQDATERRREEEVRALREGAERIHAIIEAAHDAFAGIDADGVIRHWNRQAEATLGWPRGEAIGRPFLELIIPAPHRQRLRRLLDPDASPATNRPVEIEVLRRDGRELPVEMMISPVRWGETTLFSAFLRDITERKRAAEARARLLEQVLAAQEEERCRIARDLHDGTGQSLTSLLFGLRALEKAPDLAAARTYAAELRRLTTEAIEEVRRMARGLRPSVLDDLGLVAALDRYVSDFAQAYGMAIEVRAPDLDCRRLPATAETALYRIVQEALTNVARHSRAKSVRIVIECDPSTIRATVEDDGVGFDRDALLRSPDARKHLGLTGMEERAALLNGAVTIESRPGAGTVVRVHVPLTEDDHGEDPRPDRR